MHVHDIPLLHCSLHDDHYHGISVRTDTYYISLYIALHMCNVECGSPEESKNKV